MHFLNLKITCGYKVIYVFVWIFVMDIKNGRIVSRKTSKASKVALPLVRSASYKPVIDLLIDSIN